MNIILNTDSYKPSHYKQLPPGTEYVYAYVEARYGDNPWVVALGLQMFEQQYLSIPFIRADIDEAEEVFAIHGVPFNREGWEYILEKHGGYLPLEIRAVPEGSVVPLRSVIATVVNTDPNVPWLTSYMETAILRSIWYATTVATNSRRMKEMLYEFWEMSSDEPVSILDFKLHDFGARGVSSEESAAIGGMAHLVNFKGTDTISGIMAAKKYYDAGISGFSIPASEHSTITSWGKDNEEAAYRNMLTVFGPEFPIIACVSDSYDLDNALHSIFGGSMKQDIIDSGKTFVVRPDSGDPATMVCSTIQKLMDRFGYHRNEKGYLVLPPCIRVIQGDGITIDSLPAILDAMREQNLSIDNVAFGMGGGLLQQVNRDTYGFAMKTSAICVDGEWRDVFKDPKTDPQKVSKRGRFDMPRLTYRNGELFNKMTFEEVRANAAIR